MPRSRLPVPAPAPGRVEDPTAVRLATEADVAGMCAMLARAFDDDPVACYLVPSAWRRGPALRAFFRLQLINDHHLAFGGVFTTDDHAGTATWAPPGKPRMTGVRALLGVLPLAPYYAGPALPRALRFLAQLEAAHPREPHWYLATLGTEPALQGRGIGSDLLAPVLARCDADGMRAYLESSKEANIAFYRRHGFEVTAELRTEGGPTLWQMWREPTPPS